MSMKKHGSGSAETHEEEGSMMLEDLDKEDGIELVVVDKACSCNPKEVEKGLHDSILVAAISSSSHFSLPRLIFFDGNPSLLKMVWHRPFLSSSPIKASSLRYLHLFFDRQLP
ncbi:ribosomal protein S5 [Corchorus olitorius]|uniref:Ribosomal protein S5 n=1 Tax=Corchorus olitorius TaxID=93759 RepID=A0A1R3KI01_9ROSI|nr:ribosomal protein S5 [Corchorus olitorius]